MIRSSARITAAVAAVALLSACGGGGQGPGAVTPLPAAGNNPVTNTAPGSFAWGRQILAKLPYSGPLKNGTSISMTITVRMQNPQGLVQYAQEASTPGSAMYRHWLTPQEIGARFGASSSDYQAAASYLTKFGLLVGTWPQREVLTVSGTTEQFQRAFGTSFGTYTYLGKHVIAPIGAPHLAAGVPIVGAMGLMNAPLMSRDFLHGTNADFFGYSPQQIATGFDYSGAYANGINGSGINVGIIGTGPILDSSGKDDDTAAYASFWKAQMAPITQVNAIPQAASTANGQTGTGSVDANPGGLAPAPPVTAPTCSQTFPPNYVSCNPEDGEAQLDTESIASLAPGSSVLFYMAYNPAEYCYDSTTGQLVAPTNGVCPSGDTPDPMEGIQLADDSIQQAIADDKADAISMSFGGPENLDAAFGYIGPSNAPGVGQIEMASLAAEGIAVFVSSGDDGAWECFDPSTGAPLGTPCVSYPASDPNVVAVGGVNIPLDESGNLTGEISAWADNTTLGGNGAFQNNVGSGGGVSSVFAAPAWQASTIGTTMRELPDMSLDADPDSGQSIIMYGGSAYQSVSAFGGTSMSAPEAAAQWALVLQACKQSATCNQGGTTGYRLGNPAPLFYAIYGTSSLAKGAYSNGFTPQLNYGQVFTDVIYGGNQGVPAPAPTGTPPPTSGYESGPGYDQVTGIGAPSSGHLIQAVTGTKLP
ncbi:MAG TPA: protease pro-enzyme activation domain-containing protein [Candidatus Baltobacteraceae bacterium]|nr:protease pro-enzyme activation domain-containing protein [Candidatus Baltobacteraceae bacterium]